MHFLDPLSRAAGLLILSAAVAVSCPAYVLQQAAAKPDTPATSPQQASPQTTSKPNEPAPAAPQAKHVRPIDAAAPLPTRYDFLRGAYGPYRANNDLLYYHLDIRVDPEKQFVSGKNTIRFKMLKPGKRIQLDLVPV